MKKLILIVLIFFCYLLAPCPSQAQSNEAVQLVLNWQKLQQLRKILDNMYKGYQILSKGYNTIKDISEGDFNLHQIFLDGLLEVNPAIKDYHRIAQIIQYQHQLVSEYKTAWNHIKNDSHFTPEEIAYIEKVYSKLFQSSLKNLDELIMVTTASKLRMSDDERLAAIDRIFVEIEDKLAFLRYFNQSTRLLSLQREKDANEITVLQKLHEGE